MNKRRLFIRMIRLQLRQMRQSVNILHLFRELKKPVNIEAAVDRLEDCLDRIDDLVDDEGSADAVASELIEIQTIGRMTTKIKSEAEKFEFLSRLGDCILSGARIIHRLMEKMWEV